MGKTIQTCMVLAALITGLFSCSQETAIQPNDPAQKGNKVVFTLNTGTPATRATGTPPNNPNVTQTPALDREKKVTSLYAVVFNASDGLFYKTVKVEKLTGSDNYRFDMERAGEFDIYLVANPSAELVAKLEAGPASVDALDALVVNQSPGENNQAENFVMTSKQKTTVNTTASNNTDAGTIDLQRLSARFDLFNRVEKLKITGITFINRYVESALNRGAANLDMGTLVNNNTKTYREADGLDATGHECVAAIYGYENMNKGETILRLEATYNNVAVKPHDVVIENIPVKRNHLYTIVISPKGSEVDPNDPTDPFGDFKLEVLVNDWNEGTVLVWDNTQLINKEAPSFTATGTNVTTEPAATAEPAVNPTKVTVDTNAATDVVITVTSKSTSAKLVYIGSTPWPADYNITEAAHKTNAKGELVQTFTIALGANTATKPELWDFEVQNALDTSKKQIFTIHQNLIHQKNIR